MPAPEHTSPDPGSPPFDAVVDAAPAGSERASTGPTALTRTRTRVDVWWQRMLSHPVRWRLWSWGGPTAVTLLALVLRLWNLGSPHALVFDETFYVKDAWSLWNNGYESTWPDDVDQRFADGETGLFTDTGSFVVHPPLGKWLIGLGMALFGADSGVGWRISTVIVGTLAVLLITLIARRLFSSPLLGVLAGGLMAVDGHAIVMSRVALLDTYVSFFALCGFGCILLDRPWPERRLAAALARRSDGARPLTWGPVIWARPWVIAAGVFFGMSAATKWSGLYFLAAFGVYLVVVDALARRRLGIPFFASAAALKQGSATFLLYVPTAALVYLVSWTGWFVTAGGYDRQSAANGQASTGWLSWIPDALQSLWTYHEAIYQFHITLDTPHPYQSNPLTWPLMTRPVAMWYQGVEPSGLCAHDCVSDITSIANPLIWWAGSAAALYLVVRLALRREWHVGLILMGFVGGYLPWLMYTGRTVFQFYSIAFEPYLVLALVCVIGLVLGRSDADPGRRTSGILTVVVFGAGALALSAFWYPMWTAMPVPTWFVQLHYWLPGWI